MRGEAGRGETRREAALRAAGRAAEMAALYRGGGGHVGGGAPRRRVPVAHWLREGGGVAAARGRGRRGSRRGAHGRRGAPGQSGGADRPPRGGGDAPGTRGITRSQAHPVASPEWGAPRQPPAGATLPPPRPVAVGGPSVHPKISPELQLTHLRAAPAMVLQDHTPFYVLVTHC